MRRRLATCLFLVGACAPEEHLPTTERRDPDRAAAERSPETGNAPSTGADRSPGDDQAIDVPLEPGELARIADRIWSNEGRDQLVHVNPGEEFCSLGIGHFLWFPAGEPPPYTESFPQLLAFMQTRGVELPALLRQPHCPWRNRSEFLADSSPRKQQIASFLRTTLDHQAAFIAERLTRSWPDITVAAGDRAGTVRDRAHRVALSCAGFYPLLDYLNFKGEGTSERERYRGRDGQLHGWGLLQVLLEMSDEPAAPAAFSAAARDVLDSRIDANPELAYARTGWRRRVAGYATADLRCTDIASRRDSATTAVLDEASPE
jgi:hypothetical protein